MIEKYGQAFRALREDKGVSIRKLEKLYKKAYHSKIISASNISKFEREETNIGFPTIVSLLNVLNIPVSEYVLEVEELQVSVSDDFRGIKEAYLLEDIKRLNYLKNYYKDNKDVLVRYEHLSVLCDCLIQSINNQNIDTEARKVIQQYLLNIENWHYYEVVLFANTIFIFDSEILQLLLKKAITLLDEYKSMSRTRHEVALLLSNAIQVFLENNQLETAKTYIDLVFNHLKGSRYIYEKLQFDFLLGCYYHLSGNKYKGIKKAEEAINLMRQLELVEEAKSYELYLSELVKENK